MKPLNVPTKDQVTETAKELFNTLEKKVGMVPNIYATIGYNDTVLKNYLDFDSNVGKSFSNKEKQAIRLAVSQVNGCAYCLAAHTAIAKQNGFSDDEALELRKATVGDPKLRVLTSLAKEVAETAGKISESSRDAFFAQGYKEKDLIDFLAVVLGITFTNYVHNVTEIPVDFPEVKSID